MAESKIIITKDLMDKVIEELTEYRAIGTVEELKALKEKSEPKKVVYVSNIGIKTPHCPNCNIELTMSMHLKKFCKCGQAINWQ